MDTGYNPKMSHGKMKELRDIIRDVLNEELGGKPKQQEIPVFESITAPEQRALDALNWLGENTGKQTFKPSIVAYFSRFLPVSPAFVKIRTELVRKGMVTIEGGGYLKLTESGRKSSKPVNAMRDETQGEETAAST